MNKHDYYLETIFNYDELDATLTLMNLQHNEKLYAKYKDRASLYELIFSKETKKLRITPAKNKCYTCRFSEKCECIVDYACHDESEICNGQRRERENYDLDYETLSEESYFL